MSVPFANSIQSLALPREMKQLSFVAHYSISHRSRPDLQNGFCARRPCIVWRPGRRPCEQAFAKRSRQRLCQQPTMLFDSLAEKLSDTVRKMRGVDRITEKNVNGASKEIKRALLDADVNLRVVNSLVRGIKERAVGESVLPGIEPGQMLVKIVHDELTKVMGSSQAPLNFRETGNGPTVVLLAGLQGTGKTTAAAKLAAYCLKEKKSALMVACDVYRPAAIEQLKRLGEMIGVEVFEMGTTANPREIVRRGLERARESGVDTVIIDTAGRQVIDSELMRELKDLKALSSPDEVLLVVDAMTGQEAASVTEAFNKDVEITGAILTKLDGDTRGGAALSVQQVSGKPIKFVGTGEKVERLEPFFPERMASRILGMGDVLTLVEKAQEEMDVADAEKMTRKMMEAKFDFTDFLKQTRLISKMGSFGGLMKMMPGVGNISESKLTEAASKLKVAESLINSMTLTERREPELLYGGPSSVSRMNRIAKGSGRSMKDIRGLVSDFQKMRTMMQRMSKQMMASGGEGPDAALGGSGGVGNRAQRRKAAKKKADSARPKRGFGS